MRSSIWVPRRSRRITRKTEILLEEGVEPQMPPSSSLFVFYTILDSINFVQIRVGRKTKVLKRAKHGFAADWRVTLAA